LSVEPNAPQFRRLLILKTPPLESSRISLGGTKGTIGPFGHEGNAELLSGGGEHHSGHLENDAATTNAYWERVLNVSGMSDDGKLGTPPPKA
jgi:hypothetical protein